MPKLVLVLFAVLVIANIGIAQNHLDQNGIKETVIDGLRANALQANRYKIAEIYMNSHHWQSGGFMYVEFFCRYPYPGYEKYKVELGYGCGTQSSKSKYKLIESHGREHHVKLELGEPLPTNTTYGGYENVIVPIYTDIKYYSQYTVKLTYTLNKADELSGINQIKVYEKPSPISISNFTAPVVDFSDENFSMKNGSVAENFDVKGLIKATEIKVQSTGGADFVFEDDYQLKDLSEVEEFIRTNKHLPEVPSAKQMEENGIGLAEMNKLLLQKVEELTLYLIQQNNNMELQIIQNQKLQSEHFLLKKRVSELETKLNQTAN